MKSGGTREGVWDARFNRAAIGSFVVAGVLYGGAKTNGVNNLPPQLMSPAPVAATVSPEDIAREAVSMAGMPAPPLLPPALPPCVRPWEFQCAPAPPPGATKTSPIEDASAGTA